MEHAKIERLLRLMKLLTCNINYTLDDLAKRLEIDKRTVYRYLDTFRDAGFILHKNGSVFRLSAESPYFKDITQLVHFTEEEAYIINQLIEALSNNNLLKQNLRRKLASVYNFKSVAESVVKGKNAVNVHALLEAIEKQNKVILHGYSSAHGRAVTDRIVEPFAFITNYVGVWCYDLKYSENKLFKTERIQSVEVLDKYWTSTSLHVKMHIDVFRMSGTEQIPIKLELGYLAYNLLLEEYPLAERDITLLQTGKWLLNTLVCNYLGVGRFVIGLADDVIVTDSPGLSEYITNFTTHYLCKQKNEEKDVKKSNSDISCH